MVKLAAAAIVAALAIAGVWLLAFRKSDADLVAGRLSEFAAAISKPSAESPVVEIGKSQAAAKLVAERCELSLEISSLSGSFSREELAGMALAARRHFNSISLSIHEPRIEISGDGALAKAHFSAMLIGRLQGGESVREARELEVSLKKIDGVWLFTEARARSSVEK